MAELQAIVSRRKYQEPSKTSVHGRTLSWRAGTIVTVVTLVCGHEKSYRGDCVPKASALCNECARSVDG